MFLYLFLLDRQTGTGKGSSRGGIERPHRHPAFRAPLIIQILDLLLKSGNGYLTAGQSLLR